MINHWIGVNSDQTTCFQLQCELYARCTKCAVEDAAYRPLSHHLAGSIFCGHHSSLVSGASQFCLWDAGDCGCSWTFNISPPVVTEHYRLRFPKLEKLQVYLANNPSKQEKSSAQSSTIQLYRFSTLGLLSCAQWKSTIAICRRIRRVVTPEAARSCLVAL